MRFEGKTILVVGGNSGIGLATATAFGREGGSVFITGRDPKTLASAAASIPGAVSFRTDIADVEALAPAVAAIKKAHGHLDILFVNAGVGAFASIREITPELWDQVHSVNLRGCFFAIQKALPLLRRGSTIILTGSIGADAAIPGNATYASAKAGLRALTRILAKELVTEGIRVNMVSPGPIDTPLINRNIGMSDADAAALRTTIEGVVPMGRMGDPDEVAAAVLFFASEEASFITGASLDVDGGSLDLR